MALVSESLPAAFEASNFLSSASGSKPLRMSMTLWRVGGPHLLSPPWTCISAQRQVIKAMTDSSNMPKNTLTNKNVVKPTMTNGPHGLGVCATPVLFC